MNHTPHAIHHTLTHTPYTTQSTRTSIAVPRQASNVIPSITMCLPPLIVKRVSTVDTINSGEEKGDEEEGDEEEGIEEEGDEAVLVAVLLGSMKWRVFFDRSM